MYVGAGAQSLIIRPSGAAVTDGSSANTPS